MKVDLIRKFKWYIVGFIIVVIMLSVGLSFCTWDSLSIKALNAKGNTGGYYDTHALNDYVTLVVDNNGNKLADVGDIVTFGKFYQNPDDLTTKSELRWIVVNKKGATLTLLTESVVAFGNFWAAFYYNNNNDWVQGIPGNGFYYQNYEQSTVRAWLNSEQRTDTNSADAAFSPTNQNPMFRGFMQEAFNKEEQNYILPITISGMFGSIKDAGTQIVSSTYCENYESVTDKIWLPSYSEVFGNSSISWNGKNDGVPNAQFSYFSIEERRKATTTAFARSSASNYTWKGATGLGNCQGVTTADENVWWWLRSPSPSNYLNLLMVDGAGKHSYAYSDCSYGGVRPAVCVQV